MFYKTTPENFIIFLNYAKSMLPSRRAWHIDTSLSVEDYKKCEARCFVSSNGSTFAITKSNEIISLCLSPSDRNNLKMKDIIEEAKYQGGNHTKCFESFALVFEKCGFVVSNKIEWNDEIEQKAKANGWKDFFDKENRLTLNLPDLNLIKELERGFLSIDDLISEKTSEYLINRTKQPFILDNQER